MRCLLSPSAGISEDPYLGGMSRALLVKQPGGYVCTTDDVAGRLRRTLAQTGSGRVEHWLYFSLDSALLL